MRTITWVMSVLMATVVGCANDPLRITRPTELPLADEPASPERATRRVATLQSYADTAIVELPAVVRAGQPATVYVTTYGGGCVAEDTTVVTVVGMQADVVPYQRVPAIGPRTVCTRELRLTRRPAVVTFATAGVATLQVTGRRQPDDVLFTMRRTIRVQ